MNKRVSIHTFIWAAFLVLMTVYGCHLVFRATKKRSAPYALSGAWTGKIPADDARFAYLTA